MEINLAVWCRKATSEPSAVVAGMPSAIVVILKDVDEKALYDAIDPDDFCDHHGIVRAEE